MEDTREVLPFLNSLIVLLFLGSQNPQNRQNLFFGWGSLPTGGFPAAHGCAAAIQIIGVLHCFAGFVTKLLMV
jgi:hypothetical protein